MILVRGKMVTKEMMVMMNLQDKGCGCCDKGLDFYRFLHLSSFRGLFFFFLITLFGLVSSYFTCLPFQDHVLQCTSQYRSYEDLVFVFTSLSDFLHAGPMRFLFRQLWAGADLPFGQGGQPHPLKKRN
ncbi:hypothetical protein Hanom_Chr13g01244101 [Helianthus anomalus]